MNGSPGRPEKETAEMSGGVFAEGKATERIHQTTVLESFSEVIPSITVYDFVKPKTETVKMYVSSNLKTIPGLEKERWISVRAIRGMQRKTIHLSFDAHEPDTFKSLGSIGVDLTADEAQAVIEKLQAEVPALRKYEENQKKKEKVAA